MDNNLKVGCYVKIDRYGVIGKIIQIKRELRKLLIGGAICFRSLNFYEKCFYHIAIRVFNGAVLGVLISAYGKTNW